jgi:hypothetical protein
MSIPIVGLPIERVDKHRTAAEYNYADDREIDPRFAAKILDVLGGQVFRKAPFFTPNAWSYACCPIENRFNVARGIPEKIATELATKDSMTRAGRMPTSQWSSVLRNAMSHGGIAYLDAAGKSTFDQSVAMFAFVSGKYDEDDRTKLIGLQILRVSEENYRQFLHKWVSWLRDCALT